MSEILDVLTQLGYSPKSDKDGWRMASLYRQGDNETALKVYNDGWCQDFVTNERFNLESLIQRTLNIDTTKAKDWLKGKITIDLQNVAQVEKIKVPEFFDERILKDLIPDFSYWESRGIDKNVAAMFKGGLCLDSQTLLGKLKKRQILCIYNSQGKLNGFTARDITGNNNIKWKHLGEKSKWVWPAYLNQKFISEMKEVILVESPADVLKMWQCDIKNVICLFGLECSFSIVNFLLKKNPKKIIIASNNEESGRGNSAAEKVYGRLKKYFNYDQLLIKLPYKKDFGEMSCDEIKEWYNNRYN